ncbi:MAG TPA: electron transfer flavoprotein subunit alpha/FixB family protein, partial [Candidatus Eisenbacteria bacterium]|nr:electron transfer flavoprotein subunit alpha/FixB family protein [Candidatus Eisenbacteria bacterium]
MILVVAEIKDGAARKVALEILAEARRLADAKGMPVGVLVLGTLGAGESDRLAQHGADRVLQVLSDALGAYAPELWAEAV